MASTHSPPTMALWFVASSKPSRLTIRQTLATSSPWEWVHSLFQVSQPTLSSPAQRFGFQLQPSPQVVTHPTFSAQASLESQEYGPTSHPITLQTPTSV